MTENVGGLTGRLFSLLKVRFQHLSSQLYFFIFFSSSDTGGHFSPLLKNGSEASLFKGQGEK